jgi:hypothetical protein
MSTNPSSFRFQDVSPCDIDHNCGGRFATSSFCIILMTDSAKIAELRYRRVPPIGQKFHCESFRTETRIAIVWITLPPVSRRTLIAIIVASYDETHRVMFFCFSGSRTLAPGIILAHS